MKWLSSVAGGATAALIVTAVWWIASQPHRTPVGELHDLETSRLCLTPDGTPRAGSPTIGQAWRRSTGQSVSVAHPLYHGQSSIELPMPGTDPAFGLSFVRTGLHTWRAAQDPATVAWMERICRQR